MTDQIACTQVGAQLAEPAQEAETVAAEVEVSRLDLSGVGYDEPAELRAPREDVPNSAAAPDPAVEGDRRSSPTPLLLAPPDNDNAPTPPAASAAPVAPIRSGRLTLLHRDHVFQLPNPVSLISGLVPSTGLVCIVGEPGSGKTFVALDISAHVATGKDYLGRKVRQGRVIYIAQEGKHGYKARIAAWEKEHGITVPNTSLAFLFDPIALGKSEDQGDLQSLLEEDVRANGPISLVVVDTFSRTFQEDENSSILMRYMGILARISAALNCSILLIHHTPKDTSGKRGQALFRGHGSFTGALDGGYLVEPTENGIVLSAQRAKGLRDDESPPDLHFTFKVHDVSDAVGFHPDGRPITSRVVVPDLAPASEDGSGSSGARLTKAAQRQAKILDLLELEGRVPRDKVAGRLGDTESEKRSVREAMAELIRRGLVQEVDGHLERLA